MKNQVTALLGMIFLLGCSQQNSADILTDQCVADGMKLEGCTCLISLMEKHLPEDDMRDLAKAAKSEENSDQNMDRLLEDIERKMKTYMESLPVTERIKTGTEIAVETAKCSPKLF